MAILGTGIDIIENYRLKEILFICCKRNIFNCITFLSHSFIFTGSNEAAFKAI